MFARSLIVVALLIVGLIVAPKPTLAVVFLGVAIVLIRRQNVRSN